MSVSVAQIGFFVRRGTSNSRYFAGFLSSAHPVIDCMPFKAELWLFCTCPNNFSDPIDQDICTLEYSGIRVAVGDCSVTECRRWRPPYQNRQICTCARRALQTQRGRTNGAGCVRQWFRTAEPLGERRYENRNTHTHTYIYSSNTRNHLRF